MSCILYLKDIFSSLFLHGGKQRIGRVALLPCARLIRFPLRLYPDIDIFRLREKLQDTGGIFKNTRVKTVRRRPIFRYILREHSVIDGVQHEIHLIPAVVGDKLSGNDFLCGIFPGSGNHIFPVNLSDCIHNAPGEVHIFQIFPSQHKGIYRFPHGVVFIVNLYRIR